MRAFRQKTPWIIPGFACRYLSSLSCVYPYVSECECVDAHRRRQPPCVVLSSCFMLPSCGMLPSCCAPPCCCAPPPRQGVMLTIEYEVYPKQLLRGGWCAWQLADTGGESTLDDKSMSTGCFGMCFRWNENKLFKDPSMSRLVPCHSSSVFC